MEPTNTACVQSRWLLASADTSWCICRCSALRAVTARFDVGVYSGLRFGVDASPSENCGNCSLQGSSPTLAFVWATDGRLRSSLAFTRLSSEVWFPTRCKSRSPIRPVLKHGPRSLPHARVNEWLKLKGATKVNSVRPDFGWSSMPLRRSSDVAEEERMR
jgi:hypothetical protein